MEVIPAIDLIDGKCVRLYQGDYERKITYTEDPVEQALRFQAAGFRRIHVIDLEGAKAGRGKNREAISGIVDACRVPVQVGGGIRTPQDVAELFGFGTSFLIVSTIALEEPEMMEQWTENWGGPRFILSLDLRAGKPQTSGWLEETDQTVAEILARVEGWGLRQVICTDVDRDGTLEMPNYDTYRRVLGLLPEEVELIAAGGISLPEHIESLREVGLHGAVVGRALYEGEVTWEEMLRAG